MSTHRVSSAQSPPLLLAHVPQTAHAPPPPNARTPRARTARSLRPPRSAVAPGWLVLHRDRNGTANASNQSHAHAPASLRVRKLERGNSAGQFHTEVAPYLKVISTPAGLHVHAHIYQEESSSPSFDRAPASSPFDRVPAHALRVQSGWPRWRTSLTQLSETSRWAAVLVRRGNLFVKLGRGLGIVCHVTISR
jgi:hypothetical protein